MNDQFSQETQAFKTTRIFLGGILVGAALVAVATQGFKFNQAVQRTENKPEQVAEVPAPSQPPLTIAGKLDRLGQDLYQDGITVSTKVNKVYPGAGFILEDFSGTKLFVSWKGDPPEDGQTVSIKGTLSRLSRDKLIELSQEPLFTSELLNFLNNQKIIIEAKEISSNL